MPRIAELFGNTKITRIFHDSTLQYNHLNYEIFQKPLLLTHPETMMIKFMNASFAFVTVLCAIRLIDFALFAVSKVWHKRIAFSFHFLSNINLFVIASSSFCRITILVKLDVFT